MTVDGPRAGASAVAGGLVAGALSALAEVSVLWMRAGRLGGSVVVRCGTGHVYTSIWIPGISVKSLRSGWWRLLRGP